MRYVDIPAAETPDPKWLKKSNELFKELKKAKTRKERQEIIDRHKAHWSSPAFKTWLLGLFHNKCWYTEATGDASSMHVDHFRPKGRVKTGKGSRYLEGYWWLAFDWKNYRICGDLINVKKKDEFPVKGTFRASGKDKRINIENAVLIDPRKRGDVALISYDGDGRAVPAGGISLRDQQRVKDTCDILGLNKRTTIIEGRQKIWSKCLDYIYKFRNADKEDSPLDSVNRAMAIEELKQYVKREEPYSMVASACVRKHAAEALISQVFS